MPYDPFLDNKPVSSDNGLVVIDETRQNLMAMRDAVVMGAMSGWDYNPNGGTADQPAEFLYSKGTERIRGAVTWGTSGGADGNVTQIVWSYSSNSGSTYDTIGTQGITYDVDANVTAIAWT